MFNFLNSAVLIAAAAALIPLLIHLFSKRKVRIIEFSSLKHLKEMQKRQVRRIKIRQLLLLLLRMLIILIAVLAFARPATKGGYIGSHAGVSSVILLDRSASMQRQVKDGETFDLAKKSAESILENFGQSDEILVIPYDRKTYFPAGERFFSRDIAENVLAETNAGYEADNFGEAYNKALGLLEQSQSLNKELYIITDRQLSSLPDSVNETTADISTYFVDIPVETDGNCGVVDIDMGGQLIEVGADFSVKAEIQNYDTFAKSQLLASLFVDGIRVMQSEFSIDESGRQFVQFKTAVHQTGFHSGWVELSDDGFPADNRYYFSFIIPDRFNILIVDGDNGGELVRLALVPAEKLAMYWSVKMIDPDRLGTVNLRDYDAVVLSGIKSLGSVETSQLLKFVDGGGGMFLIAGADMEPQYFNQNFASKLDINLIAPPPSSFTGAGYYTLERFDYTHPIFKAFSNFRQDSLPTFRFYALPKLEGAGSRSLAYFSDGTPAVVETAYGLGRIVMMTSPIIPRYTDLPSHSFFVPFVIRTVEYLAGSVSEYESKNLVGENVFRSVTGRLTKYGAVQLMTPDNRIFDITGTEQVGRQLYDCRPVDIPGLYQLRGSDRLIDLFPVNLSPSEGNLASVDFNRFKSALGIEKFKMIPYNNTAAAVISEARFGRELWKIFLWAAVIIMAVEMLFSRETEPELKEP